MRKLLRPYVGREIGANLEDRSRLEWVKLLFLEEDHFTLVRAGDGTSYHFPYSTISEIKENAKGVPFKRDIFHHEQRFPLVIVLTVGGPQATVF